MRWCNWRRGWRPWRRPYMVPRPWIMQPGRFVGLIVLLFFACILVIAFMRLAMR